MKKVNFLSLIYRIKSILFDWGFSWKGIRSNHKGEWLLIGQLLLIAANFIKPYRINVRLDPIIGFLFNIFSFFAIAFGLLIILRAIFDLGNSLSPLPEPKKGGKLINSGVYKDCRHPLYQGLIIFFLGISIFLQSVIHLIILLLLSLLLIKKAKLEEKKLQEYYKNYKFSSEKKYAIFKNTPYFDWNIK